MRIRQLAVAAALVFPALAPAQDSTRTAPIQDNSFLIEEAYNQEPGVVQHITTFARGRTGRAWALAFTQEWPAFSQRHQLSYTIPILQPEANGSANRGFGDIALNYRYQLRGMHGERTAIAPRLSVLLPSGSFTQGTGSGGTALQLNLPVSVELSRSLVTHFNAGATLTPYARSQAGAEGRTTSYNVGESLIWLLGPRVNLMLEASWQDLEQVDDDGTTSRISQLVLAPGIRWAYDLRNGTQIVPGIAMPIANEGGEQLFLYLSIEHPF